MGNYKKVISLSLLTSLFICNVHGPTFFSFFIHFFQYKRNSYFLLHKSALRFSFNKEIKALMKNALNALQNIFHATGMKWLYHYGNRSLLNLQ